MSLSSLLLFLSLLCDTLSIHVSPAPSAAPTSVRESGVTSSNITVQWGAVDCIHHNGDITGYSVRYGVQGTAEGDRTVKMATGDSSGGMYTISGLSATTVYTVEVAAVNSADTGVYSSPIIVVTVGEHSNTCSCVWLHAIAWSREASIEMLLIMAQLPTLYTTHTGITRNGYESHASHGLVQFHVSKLPPSHHPPPQPPP